MYDGSLRVHFCNIEALICNGENRTSGWPWRVLDTLIMIILGWKCCIEQIEKTFVLRRTMAAFVIRNPENVVLIGSLFVRDRRDKCKNMMQHQHHVCNLLRWTCRVPLVVTKGLASFRRIFFLYVSALCVCVYEVVRDSTTKWNFHKFDGNVMDQRACVCVCVLKCSPAPHPYTTITAPLRTVVCVRWVLKVSPRGM